MTTKKIYLAKNLDELQHQADEILSSQTQFNDCAKCNKILELYDKALKNLDSNEIDQEVAYVYLWRFIQLCFKIKKSKLYLKDAIYIDSLLSKQKQAKAITLLETLTKSLKSRYTGDDLNELKIENIKIKEDKPTSKNDEEIQQIIEKLFINSTELVKLIVQTKLKLLIIDCRSKAEFNFAHLDLSYIIKANEARLDVDYINLNNDLIKSGLVLWKLEEQLRNEQDFEIIECLNKRSKYDYLILFDSKSIQSDLTVSDNRLAIVKRAFYEFDQDIDLKCKHEPIVLNGGWLDWIRYYPAYKKKNGSFVSLKQEEVKKPENLVLNIDYPKLDEPKIESDEDNTTIDDDLTLKPTPNFDRLNKPSSRTSQKIDPPAIFQRPANNIFLNQVYKPANDNVYFVKPLKTSIMTNGIVKYLNQTTGTLDYVYDVDSKTQYTPNDDLPPVVKREFKKPIVIPTIPERKKVSFEEPKPIPALKRTFSSPNIEKLMSDEDNINEPEVADIPKSIIETPKPNVNRENKPMPDNVKRMRLDNLEPQWSNVHPGLTGIRNLGNTCFMNSIIQCLNNTKELKEYFLSEAYRKDLNRTNPLGFGGEIADEFSILVHALWWGHCKTIAPKRFKALIGQFNSQFLANDQQDAQEFLLFLLDGLHEDLNKVVDRPRNLPEIDYDSFDDTDGARQAWEHHKKLNNSIIVDLFQGMFRSIVACLTCGKQSVKFDAFMYLTLPISQSRCSLYVRDSL
jgi:hypothetical protein